MDFNLIKMAYSPNEQSENVACGSISDKLDFIRHNMADK
jgi:hypothetical protein